MDSIIRNFFESPPLHPHANIGPSLWDAVLWVPLYKLINVICKKLQKSAICWLFLRLWPERSGPSEAALSDVTSESNPAPREDAEAESKRTNLGSRHPQRPLPQPVSWPKRGTSLPGTICVRLGWAGMRYGQFLCDSFHVWIYGGFWGSGPPHLVMLK